MGIANVLIPSEENKAMESVSTESQPKFTIRNTDETESNTEGNDDDDVYITTNELTALAIATAVL